MPLLSAATAGHLNPALLWLTLVVVGVAWLAVYALACWIWPFRACRRCGGAGRRRSPSGRAFRLCKRCKHTGRQLRLGRRLYNFAHAIREDGAS